MQCCFVLHTILIGHTKGKTNFIFSAIAQLFITLCATAITTYQKCRQNADNISVVLCTIQV